jgi:hypothetical protein
MIDYEAQIARYANPPNHELEQMIGLGVIIGFVLFISIVKKTNPKLYEKIINIWWLIVGVLLVSFLYNKIKNKE